MDDLISASECQEIVTKSLSGSQATVLSYNITPFGDEVLGFLGEYFRLIVQIEENVSESYSGEGDGRFIGHFEFSRPRSVRDLISSSRCHDPIQTPGR